MNDSNIQDYPANYARIARKSEDIGFTMPSDVYIGSLLKTLVSSKPEGRFLELGTGIGLSLSWMIDGMDAESNLISVDNDPKLIAIVKKYFGKDERVVLHCAEGSNWIKTYTGDKFDLVFADAWPGKYSETDEVLNLIEIGGFYVIDDMLAQPNWPERHYKNVKNLVAYLENRADFNLTKMSWSTGLIIAVRTK